MEPPLYLENSERSNVWRVLSEKPEDMYAYKEMTLPEYFAWQATICMVELAANRSENAS